MFIYAAILIGNTFDFCILIFYPATLLNMFLISNFLEDSLGTLCTQYYTIYNFSFTSSFPT